jgi:hypothetical protein
MKKKNHPTAPPLKARLPKAPVARTVDSTVAWKNALEQFKKQEKPEAVLLVCGNAKLTRIAVAWSNMHARCVKKPAQYAGKDHDSLWQWLWENTAYLKEEILCRIPGSRQAAEHDFTALVANRVLYPDGTLNSFVERYLREKVLELFGVARKKRHTA